jgi:glutathione peroxidase
MTVLFPLPLATLVLAYAAGCGSTESAADPASATPVASAGAATSNATEHADTPPAEPATPAAEGLYALAANQLDGQAAPLAEYAGRVALVVNVASRCGYTPQYAGLQALSEEFAESGLVVLAFPSNEFGAQEPGSPEQIAAFCSDEYGVSFPMFEKCEVKTGPGQSPIYSFLGEQTGSVPNWNFCKYLVGRDGRTIGFYPSKVAPDARELRDAIALALN